MAESERTTTADWKDFEHTGPGTLAGRYLRRFWQPVYLAEDLPPGRAEGVGLGEGPQARALQAFGAGRGRAAELLSPGALGAVAAAADQQRARRARVIEAEMERMVKNGELVKVKEKNGVYRYFLPKFAPPEAFH